MKVLHVNFMMESKRKDNSMLLKKEGTINFYKKQDDSNLNFDYESIKKPIKDIDQKNKIDDKREKLF